MVAAHDVRVEKSYSKYKKVCSPVRKKENFELKTYRNTASKDRREAITAYWAKKSAELHEKPSAFYKTFQPFINAKSKESPDICLRTSDGSVTSNQTEAT